MPRLVFSYYNAFSGLSIYDDYYIALYNVLFTSIPLLVRALFEQDVNYVVREKTKREEERDIREEERKDKKKIVDVLAAQEAKFLPTGYKIDNLLKWKFPKIYDVGKDHKFFNFTTCVLWILEAAILGIVSTLLVLYLIGTRAINSGGYTSDLWMCSITIYSIIIILSSVKIFMHVQHMTLLFIFSLIACSLTPYLVYMWISNYTLSRYVKGTVIMCFRNFNTYCVVLFVSCLAILFISVVNYIIFHRNGMTRKILLKM
jgi:phospholipid-translocating ATPase